MIFDTIKNIFAKVSTTSNSSPEVKKRGIQSLVLFSSLFGAMGFSFLGSIITSRILGPVYYGDLKFIQTQWMLLSLVSTFGFFQSGSRVLLLETDPKSAKQIIGVTLVIALIMGIVIGLATSIMAYPIDYVFHTQVATIVLALAPLIVGLTLRDSLYLILQSTNQIGLLAALSLLPTLFYLIALFTISKMMPLTTEIALAIQQTTLLIVVIAVIVVISPSFGSFRHFFQKIQEENKKFGFPIYTGSLANSATVYINSLAISYWVDNTAIGFFSLASTLTEPLKLIPNSVATSSYRSFSSQKKVSKKILWLTIILSTFSLVVAWFFYGKPFLWFYSVSFASVGPMARIIALGAIAFGFGDLFNRFLGAHGQGEKVRNVAYLNGVVNVLGFIFLTPLLGVNGAVITSVLGGLSYFIFMFISYKRFISSL